MYQSHPGIPPWEIGCKRCLGLTLKGFAFYLRKSSICYEMIKISQETSAVGERETHQTSLESKFVAMPLDLFVLFDPVIPLL